MRHPVVVDFDKTRVDHQPLEVGIVHELFEQRFPQAFVAPTAETVVGVFSVTVSGGQIVPGSAAAQDPENGVEETTILACNPASLADLGGKVRFKKTPGVVRKIVPMLGGFHVARIYSEEL